MEGAIRPGHFDGVATVVEKLLRMFNPSDAYFGEKDFQQLILIKKLVKELKIKVNINGCKTIREDDGLAMSSRNKLLSIEERKIARNIIRLLKKAKQLYKNSTLEETKSEIFKDAILVKNLNLEYFEILDISMISGFFEEGEEIRAFISCKVWKISLIDKTKVLFLKLKSAGDFSASDKQYVDLVFVILAPKNCQSEHLLVLSSISSFVKNKNFVDKLRKLKNSKDIYNFFGQT